MKLSLSTKWFLWLSVAVTVFCMGQVLGLVGLEVVELRRGEGSLQEELTEIAVLLSISGSVFVLMLGWLRFVSRRMIRPIRAMAESAHRIGEGELQERVEGPFANDEVGMLASTINRAFDRYHEAVQRLDRFAGNAAHQLRTPLASIRSLGEVCLQKDRHAPEYRECIGTMLEVIQELTDTVDRLLMIARLDPARVRRTFVPVDVSEVVSQVLDLCGPALQQRGIQCRQRMAAPLTVAGDMALLRQAVGNVLDNAVRYTPAGGSIAVTLDDGDGCVALAVSDTGPGMPEALRLAPTPSGMHASRTSEVPTGRLGLVIVSEIMRVHGGVVEIKSSPGGGTCVRLVWPLAAGRAFAVRPPVSDAPCARPLCEHRQCDPHVLGGYDKECVSDGRPRQTSARVEDGTAYATDKGGNHGSSASKLA